MTRTMHTPTEEEVELRADAPRGRRRRLLVAAAVAAVAVLGTTLAVVARDAATTDVSQGGAGSSPEPAEATTGQEPAPSEPAPAPAPAPASAPAAGAPPSSCPAPSAVPPEPRYGAVVSAEPGGLMVLGGRNPDGTDRSDGWSFACGKWARPATPLPPGGFGGLAAYDPARNATVLLAADNTTWTNAGGTWAQRRPATSPTKLHDPSMAYDETAQRVLLFGPARSGGAMQLWSWDGATWARLWDGADGPSSRSNVAAAYDGARRRLVVFGGMEGYGEPRLDDTWTWDGTRWAKLNPAHRPPPGFGMAAYDPVRRQVVAQARDGSTWTWDGADWTLRSPAGSPGPGSRGYAAMVWQPGLDRVVVFGGQASSPPNSDGEASPNTYFNDLWAWDGSTWARVS